MTAPVTTVTITGADDTTNVRELAEIAREYPSVEWAILMSTSRKGSPRYPSEAWQRELRVELCARRMRVAAHLCGETARRLARGEREVIPENFLTFYDRIQLNGFDFMAADAETVPPVIALMRETSIFVPFTFVLQARNSEDLTAATRIIRRAQTNRVEILFDPSGGTGQRVTTWPVPPRDVRLGYAGGIGPDNVREVLNAVSVATIFTEDLFSKDNPGSHSTWIDMESRVRTDDRLDLEKVRAVLRSHADYARCEWRSP